MSRFYSFNLCLTLFLFFPGGALQSKEGTPPRRLAEYRQIVVADDALPVTRFAARDLAEYAEKITGSKVEIVKASGWKAAPQGYSFFVGSEAVQKALNLEFAPWSADEEWMIKTIPEGLVLAGNDAPGAADLIVVGAGSQLAVYTLLDDHLGIKWFWPGPFGEHVPSNPDAVIPSLDLRESPRFTIRRYSVGYAAFHTPGFQSDVRKWQRRTRQGWVPKAVFGHSWGYAFGEKEERAALMGLHPEWFALVKGKRRPPQMCTTNPEVIDRMVEFVLGGTKKNISTISPNDGAGFCECENCKALDVPGLLADDGKTPELSDRIFTYANEIARRVREKDPNKGVGIFAYSYFTEPPRRIEKLEPNLFVSLVHNAKTDLDPEKAEQWKARVKGWKKFSLPLILREGWGSHYLLDLPFLYPRQIHDSMALAADSGFIACYGEGSKGFANQMPNTWIVNRMLWNPHQDFAVLMDQFYTMAYGPVAAEMRAYFETYERALLVNWPKRPVAYRDGDTVRRVGIANSWPTLFPAAVIAEANTHLQQAEAKVPPGEYADRVAFHRFGQEYTETMMGMLTCYQQLANLNVKGLGLTAKDEEPDPDLAPDAPPVFGTVMHSGNNRDAQATQAQKETLLKRAYELGERREKLLLEHRNWAAINEGLYAFTNERGYRQWHASVKKALNIDTPSAVTRATLKEAQ